MLPDSTLSVNAVFLLLGLEHLKPFFTALLLPPVPLFALSAVAWMLLRRNRAGGSFVLFLALALLWISGCVGTGELLAPMLLHPAPALDPARIAQLREERGNAVAIIVLGGGVESWAPEYHGSSLRYLSLERLRYGLWLSRKTGWPVGFSGGLGWGQPAAGSAREAAVAQTIATEEYAQPLRWVEDVSRDTRENAEKTAEMLKPFGIKHVVIVTHAWHMPRAMRNFRRASGAGVVIEAAPIGLAVDTGWPLLRWIPSGDGLILVRTALREWLGVINGA